MIILGIDPGSVRIGFGAVKKEGGRLTHFKSGLIEIPKSPKRSSGLLFLEKKIDDLLQEIKPAKVGVEKIFFSKNRRTAIAVAETRGAILLTIAKKSIPFLEIAPTEVKLAVAGYGRASKKAVIKMVNNVLDLSVSDTTIDDVTDALAIAIAVSNDKHY